MMDSLLPVVAGCSHRTGTVQTYSSNARKYMRFCGWLNSDPFAPATERVLSMCAILYCLECSANGLASWVSAVAAFHTSLGHGELPRHTLFHAVKAGLHNVYAQVDLRAPATALDMSDLDKLRKSMDFSRLVDVRFWCATILGFQGLFRASEILRVRWEDIAIGTSELRFLCHNCF
jgi:integrase